MSAKNWMTSFHGGHCGQFCDHASGTLEETVQSAIEKGFTTYGLSEHSPRYEEDQIFQDEKDNGYTVEKLIEEFERYAVEADRLKNAYSDRIELLKGFETEFVSEEYLSKMDSIRKNGTFDYVVGSVHHVKGICIDAFPEWTVRAVEVCGGVEPCIVEYYQSVARMVDYLKPEIVGHLDLFKKFGDDLGPLDTPKVRSQMESTLEVIKKNGAVLDLNVYPFRKGKTEPYPAPWIVDMAKQEGIGFCFGDDSHSPESVGVGLDEGREYLLNCGVESVVSFTNRNGKLAKEQKRL